MPVKKELAPTQLGGAIRNTPTSLTRGKEGSQKTLSTSVFEPHVYIDIDSSRQADR